MFLFPMQALEAFRELDGSSFQGRLLHILPAREANDKPLIDESQIKQKKKTKFQVEKEKKLKENAHREEAWNPLFIRADAVVDTMADQYNMNKSDILDLSSQNLALRQAFGETNIIAATKKFLEDEGVVVEALQGVFKPGAQIQRSNTTIIVKNISAATQAFELEAIFGRFGPLSRVLLPPSKTMAIVEYGHANHAKSAFSGLAFTEFKGVPLFLEWAPTGLFTEEKKKPKKSEGETEEKQTSADLDLGNSNESTLYIKNLNWTTTETSLQNHFGSTVVRHVMIAKKKDMKNEGKLLSLGYGFVEFKSRELALEAFKTLQGIPLDGHSLTLAFSQKDAKTEKEMNRKTVDRHLVSTKLMVRNVPFQANIKEIRQLFSAYGELKSVRMPFKQGGKQHRGFAFVDYLTKEQAQNAMEMLANTHLYGRHLVIDYAEQGEGLDS